MVGCGLEAANEFPHNGGPLATASVRTRGFVFDLVANQVWLVEEARASKTNQALDVDAASACFESGPLVWEQVGGHMNQIEAYFI